MPAAIDPLIAVPIESFRVVTRDIRFDVFLRLSDENVAHVFSRTTGLDYKRLAGYIRKGVTELWIRPEDMEAYRTFVARPARAIFEDPATSAGKKIATLLNMTEQNMAEIFSQVSVRQETAADAHRLVQSYAEMMTASPQSLEMILKLVSHGENLYSHSIAVSIFSLFVAKVCGQFDRRMLEVIGLAGFLHDVGCTQLPKELLECESEYSPAQQTEFETHARLGLNMLRDNPMIPDEVRFIVYQHHEEPAGKGFPNGLEGDRIFQPAKVVAVADAFSSLISRQVYREALTTQRALEVLQGSSRHDPALVKLLATTLLRSG